MEKIILIIFAGIFSITVHYTVFADNSSELCQKTGYTVSAVNGIFTDEEDARNNQRFLKAELKDTYNGEKIDYQYLLNPSHIAGLGDLTMSFYQKIFDYEAVKDYDLVEMLKDASEKVKTQKILLVAHSQGNFYANSFYDSVAGKEGGIPQESIGVYAVATPAGRVAGGGKWLTSDTDKVIVDLVGLFPFKKIMTPNTSIVLTKGDDFKGHNFSGVYLKYRGKEIISGIRETLGRLAENNVQSKESPCLAPPKLTLAHKIQGEILSAVDPFANMAIDGIVIVAVEAYQAGKALAKGASSLSGLIAGAYDSVLPEDNKNTNNETVFFDVIKPENFSSSSALPAGQAGEEEVLPVNYAPMSRSRLDIAEEALKVLQNQILSLKNQAIVSSESIAISRLNLDIAQEQPKFIAAIYPGFGGGGDGGMASVSSLSASSADSSSSAGSSSSASESSSSTSSNSSSSSSSSSSSAPDTAPPTISSFSISECQNSLSSDGCLVATTTLNIAWSSPSSDLDYFVINNNGSVSATTATSTAAAASDNAVFSFSVSAKDLTGNFSATSTQTAEISTMPVVINEVAWAGNGSAYSADEWIELYNRTNKSINLSNWILYSAANLSPYVVLTGVISAKGYYLLERTNDNTVSDIAADKIYTGALNNSGENLILSYASSTIDEIPYDYNWYAGSDFNYSSMERYDVSAAGTSSSNWLANNTVIINGKNAGGGNIASTPKARNSANYLINRGVSVSSDMTLYASSSPYLVNNTLQTFSASSTLTIEPGVVIKFYNDAGFSFGNGAKILAQGSAADPIIFTSFYDDTFGGDTNGDNSVHSPTPGNWFGVRIDSPGTESIINNSVFRYGGKYYSGGGWTDSKANLYVANSSAVVSDSVFEYSKVYGVKLSSASTTFFGSAFRYNNNSEEGASTGLYSSVGTLTLNSNTFSNNKRGLDVSVADSASVSSNTFTSNAGEAVYSYGRLGSYSGNSGSGNGVNAISINGTITQNGATTTLAVNSLPYLLQGAVTVVASSTLAVNSGATIKGWNNSSTSYLNVYGNLVIPGVNFSDIVFGSMYDSPAKGNWGGLRFYSGSISTISGATFEYANTAITYTDSPINLSNVNFNENNLGLSADSASRTYPITASNVTFTNNTATTSPGGLW
ncbi:hypothetical protein A3H05_02715 [Candidatus Giovannonibacteria bacterium RIFCSPLOWO2_12_FULL_43_26]|uniref:LTD domain-containing protein n=1 Tax=Candidatus Giovannonibacteria bacterium RIFCSPLOWO2_12_FULL_43_26 TaxID=1798363 RepID=A0A1F5XW07_9BACT|nr:MAG: hypothetical protein A3H05_02715 [Candidatus Giovannonibacteria bacterium RIFCSPLOWO2_12_FULL_43_26]